MRSWADREFSWHLDAARSIVAATGGYWWSHAGASLNAASSRSEPVIWLLVMEVMEVYANLCFFSYFDVVNQQVMICGKDITCCNMLQLTKNSLMLETQ